MPRSSAPLAAPDWIAVDWGTSRLRAWAIRDGRAVDARASDDGMASLTQDEFERALLSLVADWLGDDATDVIACGMVGARQGWIEAPYRAVPCPPAGDGAVTAPARDPRLRVRILPGLRQDDPPDVMRGEETQIAGVLSAHPGFDGTLCLPGTHTKWVRVSAGEVVGFRTFMTGELFALIAGRSVLRHSVDDGWDDAAFATAAAEGLSRPEQVAARLFGLRAEGLLTGHAPGVARARLSGLLIGMELAAARGWWLGTDVLLMGDGVQAGAYRTALAAEGVAARIAPAEDATLAGLIAARAAIGAPA